MSHNQRRLGCLVSRHDYRDEVTYTSPLRIAGLPTKTGNRKLIKWCYDQGNAGSCTGQMCSTILRFNRIQQKLSEAFVPSRAMLYYLARKYEGTTDSDSGASIRDVIRAAVNFGACNETIFPYRDNDVRTSPSQKAFAEGAKNKAIQYARVPQNIGQLKAILASKEIVAVGVSVYTSFLSNGTAQTGVIPMPAWSERLEGGHALPIIDYDDKTSMLYGLNSWGTHWGQNGWFEMPYEYYLQFGSDAWVIRTVEEGTKLKRR